MRHARHVPEKALLDDVDAEQLRNVIERSAIVSALQHRRAPRGYLAFEVRTEMAHPDLQHFGSRPDVRGVGLRARRSGRARVLDSAAAMRSDRNGHRFFARSRPAKPVAGDNA